MRQFKKLNRRELHTLKAALDLSRNEFVNIAERLEKPNKFWLELICTRGALLAEVDKELSRRDK